MDRQLMESLMKASKRGQSLQGRWAPKPQIKAKRKLLTARRCSLRLFVTASLSA